MSDASMEQLEQIVADFCTEYGLEGAGLDEDGTCALERENGLEITLQADATGLTFFAEIGQLSAGTDRLETAEALLRANAFWIGSQGATLSLSPEGDAIFAMLRAPTAALAETGLDAPLGTFVDAAESWAKQLANGLGAAPVTEPRRPQDLA